VKGWFKGAVFSIIAYKGGRATLFIKTAMKGCNLKKGWSKQVWNEVP